MQGNMRAYVGLSLKGDGIIKVIWNTPLACVPLPPGGGKSVNVAY